MATVIHFFVSDQEAPLMSVKQFSSLAENSESIQVDQKSGFFSVNNLHGESLDPVEATKEVFTKLKGKYFDPYKKYSNDHYWKENRQTSN